MADSDGKAAKELIHDVGKQLAAKQKCPHKDFLVKLLRACSEATSTLDGTKESTVLLGDSEVSAMMNDKQKGIGY
ncbi:hypothetical protein Ccrd_024846 [Cynara cardunculus var. scolymus]|uniref:Uncharacterized protein n=1 Tax=Cynara cardunculus var. scolymus TaxID=59895 RepID=A0A103XBU3_CYNCS|nr:hypothetical protein Ccrd_024846 [Cynara cardunculus var. scolymus]